MKTIKLLAPALLVALSLVAPAWAGYTTPGLYFIEPGGWDVGDVGSTNQAWDALFVTTGNTPDAGSTDNPAVASEATLNVSAPGFATGTQNFYSFTGNYPVFSNIYNHGTGGSDGTHVIVQTAATLGGTGQTVLPGTMEIVDLGGSALTGGGNVDALVDGETLFAGIVNSSFGNVTYAVQIWEFFLPAYTGDFRVKWTEEIHSSFDQLRVDSMIAPAAFPASFVPEPTSLALAGVSVLGLALKRNRR